MIPFKRRGIRIHDPNEYLVKKQETAAGVPASPYNVGEALSSDMDPPAEFSPDPENRIKRYGGKYETD